MLRSKAEREYIQRGFEAGLRNDGRDCHDWRPLEVALAQLPQASGSARCRVGGTEVLVSVKVSSTVLLKDGSNEVGRSPCM